MLNFKVVIDKREISLDLMGRVKTFKNNEIVSENAYTKFYPQYFVEIGELTGFNSYLATPVFVPNGIEEFLLKESRRKSITSKKVKNVKPKSIEEDELKVVAEDFSKPTEVTSIEEMVERAEDFDVKIEIE